MSEHAVPIEWAPMTKWNVGKIGGKQMITFVDSFSTAAYRSAWRNTLAREQQAAQQAQVAQRQTLRARLGRRPTTEELMRRYNI